MLSDIQSRSLDLLSVQGLHVCSELPKGWGARLSIKYTLASYTPCKRSLEVILFYFNTKSNVAQDGFELIYS